MNFKLINISDNVLFLRIFKIFGFYYYVIFNESLYDYINVKNVMFIQIFEISYYKFLT